MILWGRRQRHLIAINVRPFDEWAFTSCYDDFEAMMQERNPGWRVRPGQRFAVDLSAVDVSVENREVLTQVTRLNRQTRRGVLMGTGTGGTKRNHLWAAGAALLVIGGLASAYFQSVLPICVAIAGISLQACVAMWAYGVGKATYNQFIASK
jgi:hypothetical protein